MEKSPGKILQEHMIEIEPSDPRTTEQIVADLAVRGLISLDMNSIGVNKV